MDGGRELDRQPPEEGNVAEQTRAAIEEILKHALGRKLFLTISPDIEVIADIGVFDEKRGVYVVSWHVPGCGTVRMEFSAEEMMAMSQEVFK